MAVRHRRHDHYRLEQAKIVHMKYIMTSNNTE
jgi:hypothetical protein